MIPPEDSYLDETPEDRERDVSPTCLHLVRDVVCQWCGEVVDEVR